MIRQAQNSRSSSLIRRIGIITACKPVFREIPIAESETNEIQKILVRLKD